MEFVCVAYGESIAAVEQGAGSALICGGSVPTEPCQAGLTAAVLIHHQE